MSANLRKKFVPLGEVVDFSPRFGKDELADDSLASFIPMRCVEEESGRFESLGDRKVSEVRKGYTPFRDGDVIFAKVTPCMENGKVAVLKGLTNGVGFGSTEFFALRPKNGLDAYYLFRFILQSNFRRDAARNMTGAVGLRRVPKQWLEQQTIPLPDLDEQRRIVAEIEKQFTRLEAGVAALRRVQANLKRYRAAVLKAACEGRLVPTEAELHRKQKTKNSKLETGAQLLARILTERHQHWHGRGKYKESVMPESPADVELPEGWTWAAFDQVCAAVSDEGKKIAKAEYLAEGQIPVIDQGEEFIGGFSNDESLAYAGELPVILFGDHTRRFKLANERFIVGADGVKLIGLTAVWNCKFLWYQFQQLNFEDRGYSRHFQFVRKAPLRLPPLAEQTRIVAEVERRLSVVEELESVVSANLQRATRLRQSILHKAFSGELVATMPAIQISDIIPPLKPDHIHPPNSHFARALLSAEIVHRLHGEPTFGRIKHQKIFHLCEHIAQIEEIHGQYHREAAGPLDNKLIYANEAELKKQKWYQEVRRESYGHAYQALAKAGGHRKYVERYWADKLPTIEKLIELMRKWDTERCEIFCTAYAAWNDLILWGKQATEDNILHEILERWHDSKKRFPKERWLKAIVWMKKEGFVPTGFGKPTKEAK